MASEHVPSRVCSFCGTRRGLTCLTRQGTSYVCTDRGPCEQRAAASDLYPMDEAELEGRVPVAVVSGRPGADPASEALARVQAAEAVADRAASAAPPT